METILTEILTIIKGSTDGINAERRLLAYFSDKVSEIMGIVLESIDDAQAEEYKKQGYSILKRDSRSIQFLFGRVHFKRRSRFRHDFKEDSSSSRAIDLFFYEFHEGKRCHG